MSKPRPSIPSRSRLKRWLSEPLLHFLVVGLSLFALYGALHPQTGDPGRSNRIELTEEDLRQMTMVWTVQWRRPPTSAEMHSLIEAKVREEVLAREALALGLDQGDAIVRRRLAQKMEFLAEDISGVRDPGTVELKAWFEGRPERFALPGRANFRHLYFSPDLRGPQAQAAAATALAQLEGAPADASLAAATGDRFMLQDYYADREPEQVASVFGTRFAQALFRLKAGAWQGPVESGLGWHLVFVESIAPGRVPTFEEIETDVKAQWVAEQRAESKRRTFDAMRARYELRLPATLERSP
ncbi:MAG: peptidyl-prolyl cis-trans isomerase [Variovorax sp.]|nr:MAG: peptidyl-prolyl cis-trans isomerase [Variovorax sp.]